MHLVLQNINSKKEVFLLAFIVIAWMIKSLLFISEIDLSPNVLLVFLSSIGTGLIIINLFQRRNTFNFLIVLLLYVCFTFLLYADLLYARYYFSILKIELIVHAGQIRDIRSSIFSLIQKKDILYFVDIFLLLIVFLRLSKQTKWYFNYKKRSLTLGFGLLLAISIFSFKVPYSDLYKVSQGGLIPAHFYDIGYNLYKKYYLGSTFLQGDSLTKIQNQMNEQLEIQMTSPYFGEFKGKNLIIVQAESLNTFPIGLSIQDQEVTPVMNELIKTSHYYPNTFLQIGRGNTSDAEFVANNSIYPMGLIGVYKEHAENQYTSLANQLKDSGYHTFATHGNRPDFWNRDKAYPNLGFDDFYHIDHPNIVQDESIGLGLSDKTIFHQMLTAYQKEDKPFYNFIVSLTNHRPFDLPEEYQYLNLPTPINGTNTGNYLQSVKYFDTALGEFIDQLKMEGLWDDTIFVVYGDHYGPLPTDAPEIKDLLDITFDTKTRFKIPLIIHHPGQTESIVNKSMGSQMDIYPTVADLLGLDIPLVQFGTSLDTDYEQIAGFAYETTRYSFISDKYDYEASHTGVFEDGSCINNSDGMIIEVESCRPAYNKIYNDIQTSITLLEHNYIIKVMNTKK